MVSETKHTPGPWEIEDLGASTFVLASASPARRIAKIEGWGPETEANARLIAAAPDLLAACEAVISAGESENLPTAVYDAIEAAIAKANGEST